MECELRPFSLDLRTRKLEISKLKALTFRLAFFRVIRVIRINIYRLG